MVGFISATVSERKRLHEALLANSDRGASILADPRNTAFVGIAEDDGTPTDNEVISAIKSVPCHY